MAFSNSDIDLVVCMQGDNSWRSNSGQWMTDLACDLKTCSWVSNLKAIDGAMMPVIKLVVECEVMSRTMEEKEEEEDDEERTANPNDDEGEEEKEEEEEGEEEEGVEEEEEGEGENDLSFSTSKKKKKKKKKKNKKTKTLITKKEILRIPMDITFNGALHYGIASASFVKQLVKELPSVGPVTQVLKKFLGAHNLSDPYTGGLPAYGMVLIATAIALQLRQQHRNAQQAQQTNRAMNIGQKSDSEVGGESKEGEKMGENKKPTTKNDARVEEEHDDSSSSLSSNLVTSSLDQAKLEQQQKKVLKYEKNEKKEKISTPPPPPPPPPTTTTTKAKATREIQKNKISSAELPAISHITNSMRSSFTPPTSPLLGPLMSTSDIPSLDGMVPNGLYVTGSSTSEVSLKSTPPSPVVPRRKKKRSSSVGVPFWNPSSQVELGIQQGMEIGRPWYLDAATGELTTGKCEEEEETLTAVSTTDQALGKEFFLLPIMISDIIVFLLNRTFDTLYSIFNIVYFWSTFDLLLIYF